MDHISDFDEHDEEVNKNEEDDLPFGDSKPMGSPLHNYFVNRHLFEKKKLKVVTGFIKAQMEEKLLEYMGYFGQNESNSLMLKLRSSKLFNQNLAIAIGRQDVPGCETISGIIHSSHYSFLMAKKRKIYFGSLFFLRVLYEDYESRNIEIDEDRFAETLFAILEKYKY